MDFYSASPMIWHLHVDISLHSEPTSLLFLHNVACLVEKHQIPILWYSLNQQEITNYYTTEAVVWNKYFMKWLNVFDNTSGMIFFGYLTNFTYFPLKIVFWKLLDMVRTGKKNDHFERECRWFQLFFIAFSYFFFNQDHPYYIGYYFPPENCIFYCFHLQVSVSCGIPDFRSRDGIYARLAVDFPDLPDPQAMFDISYFRNDPRPFFKFAKVYFTLQTRSWWEVTFRIVALLYKVPQLFYWRQSIILFLYSNLVSLYGKTYLKPNTE